MKRVISIFLLILFLFNVGGFYILFWGLHHHSDMALNARLDAELYSEDQLVELKIPVTLPYPLAQHGFQRIEGRFEHQGEFYKMVKHKLENDTVYILCIKDLETKRLVKNMTEFGKMANDLPASSKSPMNTLLKLIKDFERGPSEKILVPFEHTFLPYSPMPEIIFVSPAQTIPSPPPKA